MKKISLIAVCCTVMTVLAPLAWATQLYSSAELVENASAFDGTRVIYEGEAIGDIMLRTGGAWVNVHDGVSAIGCWVARESAKDIRTTGSYKATGDRIAVEGIFHRACPQHGGDLDIHADTVTCTVPGVLRPHALDTTKKEAALIGLGVLCLALILKTLK